MAEGKYRGKSGHSDNIPACKMLHVKHVELYQLLSPLGWQEAIVRLLQR